VRRGELLSVQWPNVDLEKRIAFLPMTKNGESRGIPLSSRAVTILRALPGARGGRVFGDLTVEGLKESCRQFFASRDSGSCRHHVAKG
jgi:integrase